MKKIIALTGLFLMTAGPAFATALAYDTANAGKSLQATTPANVLIAKSSKGVVICGAYTATGYSLSTYHTNGTKQYGTSYDGTAIYVKDVGVNATITAPTSSSATEAFGGAGWSAL